jgi:hypothetical protein
MAFAVSIKEIGGIWIRCDVRLGTVGDRETYIWR